MFVFEAVVLAQIGVGWVFVRYLIQQDLGRKEPKKFLILAGIFGALAIVAAAFLEKSILPDELVGNPDKVGRNLLLSSCVWVGVIEEGLKSLPLGLLIYKRKFFDEMTDGIIYFAIAGMVFGVIEDIGYALAYGEATGVARLVATPFLHAAFCVIFGWSLARYRVMKTHWLIVPAGFLLAVMAHAAYDFGLFYRHVWSVWVSIGITIAANLGLFWLFKRTQKTDGQLGLGSVGVNFYCRNCGRPNPKRFMYCPYCGQKT